MPSEDVRRGGLQGEQWIHALRYLVTSKLTRESRPLGSFESCTKALIQNSDQVC